MYLANPWGLLGLLALPAIIGLHLFRRRFPPLYVAGSHLWGMETRVAEAGRRRDRLPLTLSLFLELLAALLLTIVLSDPRIEDADTALHVVVVLDDSASMQAAPRGGPAFRDQAAAEVRRRLAAAGREARVTLVRTGRQPTLLGTRAMTAAEADHALAEWTPRAARHDFHSAWDEALQLVGPQGAFLFLTDAPLPPETVLPAAMEWLALGEPLGNLAVTAAQWTLEEEGRGGKLFLRLANLSGRDADAAVVVSSSAGMIASQTVRLPAQSEQPFELPVPSGLGRIVARLTSADDSLPVDNEVTLIEPQPRLVRVAVDLSAELPEFALVKKALDAVHGVRWVETDQADLVIGEAAQLPPSRRELWWFGIGPLNRAEAFRTQAVDVLGPYLLERQHPLLEGVTLGGIVWGGVQPTPLRLAPLVSVDRAVLLGRLEGTETTAWVMNVDLGRSNLAESPDWPILIANLIELRRDALPGLRRWNYRLGEGVQLRFPAVSGESQLTLVTPEGRERTLVRDRRDVVEIPPLSQAGVYRLQEGRSVVGEFAVNFFDRDESNLLTLGRAQRTPTTTYEPTTLRLDDPYSWLIVLAILMILSALLLDWRVVGSGAAGRRLEEL